MITFWKWILAITFGLLMTACASTGQNDTLYDKLGGNEGITLIVKETFKNALADERIAHIFSESHVPRIEKLVVEQICDLSGGPCQYSGQTMRRSHRGLDITNKDFNAFVENMQDAMDTAGTPFIVQNQLLALLAPMNEDVTGQSSLTE